MHLHIDIDGTEPSNVLRATAAFLSTLAGDTPVVAMGKATTANATAAAPTTAAASKPAGKPPGRPKKAASTDKSPEDVLADKLAADQAAQTAAEDAAEEAADDAGSEEGGEPEVIDKEAVSVVLGQLVDAGQREAVVKLLAKYKAKSISSLPESAYEAVYAAASALL